MLRVLGRRTSVNVQKVMWLAAELDLEIERVDIGGPFGGNDDPDYLSKNPNGLVPTLEDGDFILWESHSILRYISEKYGRSPWSPEDETGRALASQWMDWYLTKLHPHMTVIFWQLIRTAPEDRDVDAVALAGERHLHHRAAPGRRVLQQHQPVPAHDDLYVRPRFFGLDATGARICYVIDMSDSRAKSW